jgi:hypothetical protein
MPALTVIADTTTAEVKFQRYSGLALTRAFSSRAALYVDDGE